MNSGNASLRWARVCYGIDLQGEKVMVVRAERRHGRVTFAAPSSVDSLRDEASDKRVVCVACLTARESLTRWLDAPFSARRKADKVLPTLLDIQLPFALEDCAYCFLPVKGSRNITRALAVAARLEDVRKKVTSLAALGVNPQVLDHEGLALWTQSLKEAPAGLDEEDGLRAIVHLRGEQSTLVIGRGGEFLSAHGIRSDDVGQIRRLLKPHRAGAAKVRWFWTGSGATDVRTVSELYESLSRDWPGPSSTASEPETFLARALAERALSGGPLRCNLRCGSLTHPSLLERARRQWARTAALFLVAGLLLCASNLAARLMARQRESTVDRAFGSLADELAGFPVKAKGDAAIRIVGDKARKKTDMLRAFQNVFDPSLTETMASVADVSKRNSLHLEMLSLSRDKVQVAGTARSWNGCDELLAYLKRAGYPARLDRKDAGADGVVPFGITSGGADEP